MKFTFCSFASEEGFLGAVLLRGWLTPIQAACTAYALNLHPGGEMVALHSPEEVTDEMDEWHEQNVGRLLTVEDIAGSPGGLVRARDNPEKFRRFAVGVVPE